MVNITTEVQGTKLIITCDLSQSYGPSKSGKTIVIGTTSGNQAVKGPKGIVKVGVNIYRDPMPSDKAQTGTLV